MEFGFAEKVNILGTDYSIEVKKSGEDVKFTGVHAGAYGVMNRFQKRIVIRDIREDSNWKNADEVCVLENTKETLRHEIVHAFLAESGLDSQTKYCGAWAKSEEIVDWMALQGPKLMKAWTEAGAL